mgnify:CR=1 FL=1
MKQKCWIAACDNKTKHLHLNILGDEKTLNDGRKVKCLTLSVLTGDMGDLEITNHYTVMLPKFGFRKGVAHKNVYYDDNVVRRIRDFKRSVLKLLPGYHFCKDVEYWGWVADMRKEDKRARARLTKGS